VTLLLKAEIWHPIESGVEPSRKIHLFTALASVPTPDLTPEFRTMDLMIFPANIMLGKFQ
jgi:hypothetical protein